jgi:anti-sigma factor RsiW
MNHEQSREEECLAPPALCDTAIMAAVDGESNAETLEHLRKCPYCKQRVEQYQTLQRGLLQQLYRLWCPSTAQLIDYAQGMLDPTQQAALNHHLHICPHCAAELALIEQCSASDQPGYWTNMPVIPRPLC